MSRNEERLVSSQKTSVSTRLSDSTMPIMAPMKPSSIAKKRPNGSFDDR